MKESEDEMSEPGSRRGRVHDAEGAREAILNAAEEVFAEHGFDGARVDAIAARAGYNKSLIFQYFGDKLNLYAEMLKSADRQGRGLQEQLFALLLEDETIATDACKFRTFLETVARGLFDYLAENPRIVRIFLWEQAEGWQTYAKIASQLDTEDIAQFEEVFARARSAGLLRSNVDPLVVIMMAMQMAMSYLTSGPLYQTLLLPGRDASAPDMLEQGRKLIAEFIVHGMLIDSTQEKL
jgi:TetR/AcrR family transcriptional regulator